MTKNKLLIVDNDKTMAEHYNQTLGLDYDLVFEYTSSHALQTAMDQSPYAILLDLGPQNVDGYEVLHQLGSNAKTSGIPIIATSLNTHEESRTQAHKLGAIGFISKPIQFTNLKVDFEGFFTNINQILISKNTKRMFTIAFNETEKNRLLKENIKSCIKDYNQAIFLSWSNGDDFCDEEMLQLIESERLIFFRIKQSLTSKLPYMLNLNSIIEDIQSFLKVESTGYPLLFDDPLNLFEQNEVLATGAKIIELNSLLKNNFMSLHFFSKRQGSPRKQEFLINLANEFIGNK